MIRRLLVVVFAALAASAARAERVSRCPEGSRPVRLANSTHWACAATDGTLPSTQGCAQGYEEAAVRGEELARLCVLEEIVVSGRRDVCPPGERAAALADARGDIVCEKARPASALSCPSGTRARPTPGALRPFRCVPARAARDSLEDAATRPTRSAANVLDAISGAVTAPAGRSFASINGYLRRNVAGEPAFDYPKGWGLTDGWRDRPATLMIFFNAHAGRPIQLSISRHRASDPNYEPIDSAVEKEKAWRGAREEGRRTVDGASARVLRARAESDTAFVPAAGGYYVISYSAPEPAYAANHAAFERLLRSFKAAERR